MSNLQTFSQFVRNINDSKEVILNWGEFTSFDRTYWSTDTILIQGITRLVSVVHARVRAGEGQRVHVGTGMCVCSWN